MIGCNGCNLEENVGQSPAIQRMIQILLSVGMQSRRSVCLFLLLIKVASKVFFVAINWGMCMHVCL